MAVIACTCLNDIEMTWRNLHDLGAEPFSHQCARMWLRALGNEYRGALA